MAEAHSAVAFQFHVSHDGIHVNYDTELLNLIFQSGMRAWKRSSYRIINNVRCGVFPGSLSAMVVTMGASSGVYVSRGMAVQALMLEEGHGVDPSFGLIKLIQNYLPECGGSNQTKEIVAASLFGAGAWFGACLFLKYSLKSLYQYKGYMYEERGRGSSMSCATKVWLLAVTFLNKFSSPMLYSYQGCMPSLPLPALGDTMDRYLRTVRPLLDDAGYARMEKLTREFQNGAGKRFQRYLSLKRFWATNYVSDWWEEYVYLRGRSPLVVNSNFYGTDAVIVHPTMVQAARAASVCHAAFTFRRSIDRQTLKPITVHGAVPLCSSQYERCFNTTRIPGVEQDRLVHYGDSTHIVVMHNGRFFKMPCYHKGKLLSPKEMQNQFELILTDSSLPDEGEELLGALTAGERKNWALARQRFFNSGVNRASLNAIERAAFVVSLEISSSPFNGDVGTNLDAFSHRMLHGNGADRWYDKSFCIIVCKDGRIGFNAEHSWADAPIMGHLWEHCMAVEMFDKCYDESGNCNGVAKVTPLQPTKLRWNLPGECKAMVKESYDTATALLNDVSMKLVMFRDFGKGLMKKTRTSPDAFIQMALQLAYHRDAGKFNLTYEASMTRLFRDGRTETVRPCTVESCAWVHAMDNEEMDTAERVRLFRQACLRHQRGYQDAMCGKGIDRHLFCLYVVSRYLEQDSPFLQEVLTEPWRLSTSQTPHGQTDKLNLTKHPNLISAGGGFGPVAPDGYGVSYIIAGEDTLFFHVSSRKSSPETDSAKFALQIQRALMDLKEMFQPKEAAPVKEQAAVKS